MLATRSKKPQPAATNRPVRITVGATFFTIDARDVPRLSGKQFRVNDRGHVIFGQSFALHRYLRPDLAKVGFRDGNPLNLTRDNLIAWKHERLVRVEDGITKYPSGYKVTGYKPGPKKHAIAYHLGIFNTLEEARAARDREAHLYFPKRKTPAPAMSPYLVFLHFVTLYAQVRLDTAKERWTCISLAQRGTHFMFLDNEEEAHAQATAFVESYLRGELTDEHVRDTDRAPAPPAPRASQDIDLE